MNPQMIAKYFLKISPNLVAKHSSKICKLLFFLPDACSQTCTIMDHHEGLAQHHHFNLGGLGKPDLSPHHCHLHLRRPRHAALWQNVHRRELLSGSSAKVSVVISSVTRFGDL